MDMSAVTAPTKYRNWRPEGSSPRLRVLCDGRRNDIWHMAT